MTGKELEARVEVELEKFTMKVQIEARVLGDLAINHIVPTAIRYQTSLIDNVQGMRDLFPEEEYKQLASARLELIKEISEYRKNQSGRKIFQ
jgi:glutamine synthetase